MEERGRKRKKKKVVRFEPVVPRENASRICYFIEDKNEEEIRRIRGAAFPGSSFPSSRELAK